MTSVWDAAWHTRSPIYQPLLEAAHSLGVTHDNWPDLDDYNRLLQSAPAPFSHTITSRYAAYPRPTTITSKGPT